MSSLVILGALGPASITPIRSLAAANALASPGTDSATSRTRHQSASDRASQPIASNRAGSASRADSAGAPRWPAGTTVLSFENLEGLVLLPAGARGIHGRDTSGVLVLDTGAGFLALDRDLAEWAGISDSTSDADAVGLAVRPLPRLTLGDLEFDAVSPVMTVDGRIVRAVTDRRVLGLLGERPLENRAVWIDFERNRISLIPVSSSSDSGPGVTSDRRVRASRAALMGVLGSHARALPFHLAGDGKILLQARIGQSVAGATSVALTLLLDTGSTKCVLFQPSLGQRLPEYRRWRTARGLTAPTLIGASTASIALVPWLALATTGGPTRVRDLDVAVLKSDLSGQLSRVVGQRIDGLLGGSFLGRFGVVIDYPHRVLWLEAVPAWKNPHPLEYCHSGLQLERRDGVLRVAGLISGSPAEAAGIKVGDELVEIDGESIDALDLSAVNRRLEGRPGTQVGVAMRRDGTITRHRLTRRRLL